MSILPKPQPPSAAEARAVMLEYLEATAADTKAVKQWQSDFEQGPIRQRSNAAYDSLKDLCSRLDISRADDEFYAILKHYGRELFDTERRKA